MGAMQRANTQYVIASEAWLSLHARSHVNLSCRDRHTRTSFAMTEWWEDRVNDGSGYRPFSSRQLLVGS